MSAPFHYLTPGSLWWDRAFRAPEGWRRVVRIVRSDGFNNGFVEALGCWQMLVAGEWRAQSPERKTRIRAARFFVQYELLPEPDPSAVGGERSDNPKASDLGGGS